MSKVNLVARVVLGLIFTIFGLNGFLHFLPMPEVTPEAGAFLGALANTGYMFPIVKGIEVLVGLAFLTNRFVSLALLLIAPIIVNIALVHFILDTAGAPMTLLIVIAFTILTKSKWQNYKPFFTPTT